MKKEIAVLVFDVFGTVVDWRSSILVQLENLGRLKGVDGNWEQFLDEWKSSYRPGMDEVNAGKREWTNVDVIYRERLDQLLPMYGLGGLTEDERWKLNRAWCRPNAWPDSVNGLNRLKAKYKLSTLSNGNFEWLLSIAKHCGLAFDCILTAENAKAYKPAPKVYRTAVDLMGVEPEHILMVACHNYDLKAASDEGLRTAFVKNRKEYGPGQIKDQSPEKDWDFVVDDLRDLATQLGC